jgi:hypothetical protein
VRVSLVVRPSAVGGSTGEPFQFGGCTVRPSSGGKWMMSPSGSMVYSSFVEILFYQNSPITSKLILTFAIEHSSIQDSCSQGLPDCCCCCCFLLLCLVLLLLLLFLMWLFVLLVEI